MTDEVLYDTTKTIFETYRSKAPPLAHDWVTMPNDERRAWEAVARLSLAFVHTADERHEALERTRRELGEARIWIEKLETRLRISKNAGSLASDLLSGAGERIAELERLVATADLDKFHAEAVDDIVWCLRNNATVQFHEDKTVAVSACGFWCRRNTLHDAVEATQVSLAQADEAVSGG